MDDSSIIQVIMEDRKEITELIDRWKPRNSLAKATGANVEAVHKWAAANRIPSDWQHLVIRAAQEAGYSDIDGNWMVRAHSRTRVCPA